ncbi:carboxypeptidase-like regulatory domain-containing protein [Archangium violaceum]|uniref:carboxypeptidase-like regulatory domain-containing protein n=1 Tax=Archangium violaceum TaxID=83451 RepID=UPI0036DAC07E
MRRGTLLVVSVGALVLAVGLGSVSSPQPGPPASARPAHATRPGLSTGFLLPASTQRPSGGLRIRGIVLGESGPLGGVRVTATRPEAGQTLSELSCAEVLQKPARGKLSDCVKESAGTVLEQTLARQGESFVYAETTTADDGGFTLDGLPEGLFALWAVDTRGAGMWREVLAGTEGLELKLGEGVMLEGGVVEEDKFPLAGVRVTAVHKTHTRFFDAETGADGRYRMGPLPVAEYLLVYEKEGWLPALGEGRSTAPVRLHRPRRLTGRVLSGGAPVRAPRSMCATRPPLTSCWSRVGRCAPSSMPWDPVRSGSRIRRG